MREEGFSFKNHNSSKNVAITIKFKITFFNSGGLPAGGPTGGVEPYTTKYHVLCQFLGFNSGESRNYLHFHISVPPTPTGASLGGLGGLQGVLSPILPNIMCYVNSWVFNSGES